MPGPAAARHWTKAQAAARLLRSRAMDVVIGVSARLVAADPAGAGSRRRAQWGIECELARGLAAAGALVVLLPVPVAGDVSAIAAAHVARLDGLVLQGGSDIEPWRWGEEPRHPDWAGDPLRDAFEFALYAAARARGLPVLGICRGVQVINVAHGGSLHQDLAQAGIRGVCHDYPAGYDAHRHEVALAAGGLLAGIHGVDRGRVSSTHHQACARIGEGLAVDAVTPADGVVEALRGTAGAWLAGVQWHPELHVDDPASLPGQPLFDAFVAAAMQARRSG
jgi:gamma-glutamyl-gamma-aminobutyrate hydrolase PuuD